MRLSTYIVVVSFLCNIYVHANNVIHKGDVLVIGIRALGSACTQVSVKFDVLLILISNVDFLDLK